MKKPDTEGVIKVAIADDHALFRAGVRTALAAKRDVELIAEADNGMQLLNLLRHIEPDIILLDIQMPIMDGIQTLPEIRKLRPEAKVIILSMHNDHSMISKLMEIALTLTSPKIQIPKPFTRPLKPASNRSFISTILPTRRC